MNRFFSLFLILLICSCSNNDDTNEEQNTASEIKVNFSDGRQTSFHSFNASITDDYGLHQKIQGVITGSQEGNINTIFIILSDNDDVATPMNAGGVFNINNAADTDVYASLRIDYNGSVFIANSGTITVTDFTVSHINNDPIFSATFSVSDGTTQVNGTISNVIMECDECGG